MCGRPGYSGSNPLKIGIVATHIGLKLPSAGMEFARHRLPPGKYGQNLAIGIVNDSKGAVRAGFLDEVVPYSKTVERAHEVAFQFAASIEPNAFAANKLLTRRPALELIKSDVCQRERAVILANRTGLPSNL